MESEYGRLYTENDMLAFAFLCSGEQPETTRARLRKSQTTFPADEPLFLVRGTDRAARLLLDGQCGLMGGTDAEPTEDMARVERALREIVAWHEMHPDRGANDGTSD